MAEHQLESPLLGIAWDGTGYGLDGTIWGGDFFYFDAQKIHRLAHLKPFSLPGGDKAIKEPRRSAIGLFSSVFDETFIENNQDLPSIQAFSETELKPIKTMISKKINTPQTSSIGRLFDAVSSLVNLHQIVSFEGQGAMALEFAIADLKTDQTYPFMLEKLPQEISIKINPQLIIQAIINDQQQGVNISLISAKFHNTLVEMIMAIAKQFINLNPNRTVLLTGGCFQNQYLLERTVFRLKQEQFIPYWPQQIPTNDGAIALGQVMAVIRTLQTLKIDD